MTSPEVERSVFGGGRGNRTLLVKNLARIPRNPLLPPNLSKAHAQELNLPTQECPEL